MNKTRKHKTRKHKTRKYTRRKYTTRKYTTRKNIKTGGRDQPTLKDRFSGFLSNFTPVKSTKYYDRTIKKITNKEYDITKHMSNKYKDITLQDICKDVDNCKCVSINKRINNIIQSLNTKVSCDECNEKCKKIQKVLLNYKRLLNQDLLSLPITRIGIRRSRFPAYYKGYMTPSRKELLISNNLDIFKQDTINYLKEITGINNIKSLNYRDVFNVLGLDFKDISNRIYFIYDNDGNTICTNKYVTTDEHIDKSCNLIVKKINNLNKSINSTKKFILYKDRGNTILLLVNKDIFTTKYRPDIIDINIKPYSENEDLEEYEEDEDENENENEDDYDYDYDYEYEDEEDKE